MNTNILLFLLFSCRPSTGDAPGDTNPRESGGPADSAADTGRDTSTDTADAPPVVPGVAGRVADGEYGYLYWPGNFRPAAGGYATVRHVRTGHYGLAFDVSDGSLDHLGALVGPVDPADALLDDPVPSFPAAAVRYAVESDGVVFDASTFAGSDGSTANPSRLSEAGRYMQRIDIPRVSYAGSSATGVVRLAAMPGHFVLTHAVEGAGPLAARIVLDGDAFRALDRTTWLDEGRAATLTDSTGAGWHILAQASATLTRDASGAVSVRSGDSASGVASVLLAPVDATSDAQLALLLEPDSAVGVRYTQLDRAGARVGATQDAVWDPERGVYAVTLGSMSDGGAPASVDWWDTSHHTWYNRHELTLRNDLDTPVSVPVAFDGDGGATYTIVSGAPVLRDTALEPVGAPVQVSKNWHDGPSWYRLYTSLEVPPGGDSLELTFAHSRWGTVYAVSHAQLCLVGWGVNQHWDESALGAFGESITYDPDLTLGRAMVDDVRPFLVNAAGEWKWTGNVGGADFLVYVDGDGARQRLGAMKTDYAYTGPNLTKVTYAGVTADGRIHARITTQLGRTNDMVRAYYHLSYEVLEDVRYDRLALFQVAADGYADNRFTRYATGYAGGVTSTGDIATDGATGYANDADRGLSLLGDSPWVMLYGATAAAESLPEHLADVGFVVRAYEAHIGDTVTTTPSINLVHTRNGPHQVAFELGVPFAADAPVIPAGSRIEATVEYLVPPSVQSLYYGPSTDLLFLSAGTFGQPEMMRTLAAGNALAVEVHAGELQRLHPPELRATALDEAARFTLSGGLGYTPITFHGLARPDGWRLESRSGETWTRVDQSVEGNDYWQAHEASDGSFDLIFNVENDATTEYRLTR